MIRLLIIDDEQEIADGIFELLQVEYVYTELELYKCYNGVDAMKIIENIKIDIILTDINMPEVSGLQLAEYAISNWKYIQIIFLTGYDRFEYVYQAIQYNNAQFLLKSEPDNIIFNAVNRAVDNSLITSNDTNLLENIKKNIDSSLPILQKNFIDLLIQNEFEERVIISKLSQFRINLESEKECIAFLAKFSQNNDLNKDVENKLQNEVYMKTLLIQNLGDNFNFYIHTIDSISLLCIIQQKKSTSNFFPIVKNVLEGIQTQFLNIFERNVKLVITKDLFKLTALSLTYNKLSNLYNSSFHHNDGEILVLDSLQTKSLCTNNSFNTASNLDKLNTTQLHIYLDNFNSVKLDEFFTDLASYFSTCSNTIQVTQLVLSISLEFIKYINKYNITSLIENVMSVSPLISLHTSSDFEFIVLYLKNLTTCIFDIREQTKNEQNHNLINFLTNYIEENLDGDLSLSALANKVYLNSFYLSRQFKSYSGTNLSDYITGKRIDKAKYLINTTNMKINNIATKVGYDTNTYFNRVFKKQCGVTPIEYRNKLTQTN